MIVFIFSLLLLNFLLFLLLVTIHSQATKYFYNSYKLTIVSGNIEWDSFPAEPVTIFRGEGSEWRGFKSGKKEEGENVSEGQILSSWTNLVILNAVKELF